MTKRFMLMLIVDAKADHASISLVPRGLQGSPGCTKGSASLKRVGIPGRRLGSLPALYADYDAGGRLTGIGICKPSECLGERFRTREQHGVFPVYLTVDYTAETARIALRERRVEVFFNGGTNRAVICVREVPGVAAGTVERKRLSFDYDGAGKLIAISIPDICNQLLSSYLPSSMTGK